MKNINEQLVLNLIREHEVISGIDLVSKTGLNKSTVFSIINNFAKKNVIVDLGKGDSSTKGGRRPTLWKLNGQAFYAIGIDVEIAEMSIVVLDLAGEVVFRNVYQNHPDNTLDEFSDLIMNAVHNTINTAKIKIEKIIGVGIAFAGIIDSKNGIVVTTPILTDVNAKLKDLIVERLELPVFLENNANAAAMGAKWVGVGKDCNNFISVLMEIGREVSGIGLGLYINNRVYKGASNCAGEINLSQPWLGYIINTLRSTLEEGEILKHYLTKPNEITLEVIIDAAKKNDIAALKIVDIIGVQIGEGIASAVSIINPEMIILTGTIAELEEIIIEPIKNELSKRTLSLTNKILQVKTSTHGRYSVAVGSSALILNEFFRVPQIGLKK